MKKLTKKAAKKFEKKLEKKYAEQDLGIDTVPEFFDHIQCVIDMARDSGTVPTKDAIACLLGSGAHLALRAGVPHDVLHQMLEDSIRDIQKSCETCRKYKECVGVHDHTERLSHDSPRN